MGDEPQDEFGWKICHQDVFRPPKRTLLLSASLGSGVQVCGMMVVTLIFACLGFLSPATRGGLMTCMVVLYVCLGAAAGYVAARLYKMFEGEKWKVLMITTATLFPGIVFGIFFVLNLVLWHNESSAAIPFGTMFALLVLWFCVSTPLCFLGAYLGFKKPQIQHPVKYDPQPKPIPAQPMYTRTVPGILMGGVLPFGCVFIQLFFLLNSIWGHKLYYVFGFVAIVFLILCITVAESTILLCYFHLCAENYRWWWRAYLTASASAIYMFGYAILFYFRRMKWKGPQVQCSMWDILPSWSCCML